MSFRAALAAATARHESMLCVGLDPEPAKFPLAWRGDERRIFDFCAAIVDATADLVCAFKPQIAHFAAARAEEALERLVEHIHQRAPGVPVILDAKRGDIGSTAAMYAREAFLRYRADALTLSPFMGLVVGATYPDEIARVRALAPTLSLLIPGVGAQGGDAAATVRAGWWPGGPIVVNASRAVLCAGGAAPGMPAFATAARAAALALRGQLQQSLPAARD